MPKTRAKQPTADDAAPADEKAGWCSNCRRGSCVFCMAPKCACPASPSHHPKRRLAGPPADLLPNKPTPSNVRPIRPKKAKPMPPVIDIKPAEPPAKTSSPKLADRVRVALEEMQGGGLPVGEWHQILVYAEGTRGAGTTAGLLNSRIDGYEFTGRENIVYARRSSE